MKEKKRMPGMISGAISFLLSIVVPSFMRHTAWDGYTPAYLIALGGVLIIALIVIAIRRLYEPPA
jgi:hypothetical protein